MESLFFILIVMVISTSVSTFNGLDNLFEKIKNENTEKLNETNYTSFLPEKWFEQYLDHFNILDTRTWKQRYYMNNENYENGGPIFLILYGETPVKPDKLLEGFIYDLAFKFRAICFSLEHRYYGASQPFEKPMTIDKLAYLNSEQVLMDISYFINKIRVIHNISPKSKVVLFGSSYAGSLAVWMRLKYPHLVQGVVSQSAPLVAKIDFPEFYDTLEEIIKKHSQVCFDAIVMAFKEIFILLRTSSELQKLEELFNFCNPINPNNMTQNLFNVYKWFLSLFIHAASNRDVTLMETCEIMTTARDIKSPLHGLALLNKFMLERWNRTCLLNKNLDELKFEDNPWIYQTCTEFGWYQSTTHRPFNIYSETISASRYVDRCIKLFGPRFFQTLQLGVEHTNFVYGGVDIANVTSNIAFVHGSNDPWHSIGVLQSKNKKVSVIMIEGGGHCPLSLPPYNDDSNQVEEAIQQLQMLMVRWLGIM